MNNIYQEALVKKLALIFVQLHKDGEMESHVASQVRILENMVNEEDLVQALDQVKLVLENSKVLSSNEIVNLVYDLKSSIEDVIKIIRKETKEQEMKNVYDVAKASIKEAGLEIEIKADKAPSEIKISMRGLRMKANGNEFEMESVELEGSADVANFIMLIKGMMSKK